MELLENVLSVENLNRAYQQVYRNKGASGVDGITVEELKAYLKEHKEELLYKTRNRKYKPQPCLRVEIPKENGKVRKLGDTHSCGQSNTASNRSSINTNLRATILRNILWVQTKKKL